MTKDDKGVWSITVGPLTPDFYSYTFNVDGVRTVDPKNAMIKPGHQQPGQHVPRAGRGGRVRGDQGRARTARSAPSGIARARSTRRGACTSTRRPATRAAPSKYPVLYLLHGGGDEDSGWSTIGRAGFILDNLIADEEGGADARGDAQRQPAAPGEPAPRSRPATPPSPEVRAAMEAAQNRFTDELLKEVVPYVEKTLPRASRRRENRAIAGLSMGGGQTLARRHHASGPVRLRGRLECRPLRRECRRVGEAERGLPRSEPTRSTRRSSCSRSASATRTSLATGSKALAGVLEKHGIKHEVHISGGGHTWINWRHYLNELAPKLFR